MDVRGVSYLPVEHHHLTEWMKQKALEELGEDDETRIRCLTSLRKKIADAEGLKWDISDTFLLALLRYRKFDAEETFKCILRCAKLKQEYPEIFHISNVPAFLRTFSSYVTTILPYRCNDGCKIYVFHGNNWNIDELSASDLLHADIMEMICSVKSDEATQVCGTRFIYDFRGMTINKLRKVPLRYTKFLAQAISKHMPARLRSAHICYEPVAFSYIWAIIEKFVSNKLRNRVFFHSSNIEELHKHIEPAILPEELGGKLKYDASHMNGIHQILRETYTEELSNGYTHVVKKHMSQLTQN